MESLVEELTCPVCLDLYEQPVLLPCAHSLCKRCAGEVFASRKPSAQPVGQAMAPKHECPSCRHEFQLPEIGVDGLRKNTTLQNIVDRYRESKNNSAAPKAVPCEMCDKEPPNDALKTCLVCDTSYCEACLSTYHPMKAGLARHTLVEASAATPKALMCTEHVQEKVNMYCETDECLVCSLCKLVGKHKDHEVAAISDTFQQKKKSIGGRVAGLIQQNAEVECFVGKVQETMTKAERNCADIKGRVEAFAQSLAIAIMKRKDVLQSMVDVEKDQKLRTLGQQLGQWANTGTGISAAITEAEALLNEEDPITFLRAFKPVEDRIAAIKSLEERKLKTTDQFTHNTLGVSDLEQRVLSLDFMQGRIFTFNDAIVSPEAPRILSDKSTAGRDHITVCWAAGGNTQVDKYHVWYGKAFQATGLQHTVSFTSSSIRLQNLEESTAYSILVTAVNAAGTAASNPVNITTTRGGLQVKYGRMIAQPSMVGATGSSKKMINKAIERDETIPSMFKLTEKQKEHVRSLALRHDCLATFTRNNIRLQGRVTDVMIASQDIKDFQRDVAMKAKDDKHLSDKAELLLKTVQWYYIDDNEEKQPYAPKVNYVIEEAFDAKKKGVDFEFEGEQLHIDFRTMKETVVGDMAASAADVVRYELEREGESCRCALYLV
ncbi:MID1 [Branchiostoma lanceolatum]|uniref:MID1 protein n=1 Tax=Branchiostoma lanceolatum TaxID=7740 RepID=A0A8K0A174_BRALA|nr:MID1 [Branchiostoma lanceolatum]